MTETDPILVAAYYRFVHLPDYRELQTRIKAIAESYGILGTILLAEEGINSTICGESQSVHAYFNELAQDSRFQDLEKRFSVCPVRPFGKLKVRLKKEIVRMNIPEADPHRGVGDYVAPQDWNALIQSPNVVTIDVRNVYETEMGTFEGAIDPRTEFFSEFPKFVSENLVDKDQVIATFCTGGIRCERATAYLRQQGYRNVRHLKGGILNYLEQIPQDQSLWKGNCFVFDDRRSVDDTLTPAGGNRDDQGRGET